MLKMQNAVEADDCASGSREDEKGADSGEDCRGDERIHSKLEGTKTCPFEIGDLQVISLASTRKLYILGKIVKDSKYFQDGRFIWPEGYTAVRKFLSIVDPSVYTLYKMEVLKCNDAGPKTQPSFRVTLDNGKQWDALENKSALILYGGGAIFAIWLSSVIVDSINSVPLLPKIMELVGLGYTGRFVYRYLLFKSSRKELADEIEALKKKIAGSG
ncbi:hypothetical protein LOK49_Contig1G00014 [Camellia lanceoleosa]|nr:hypothetical protein LOK49_Contig1G00014 [Camellia lanceoleosa]